MLKVLLVDDEVIARQYLYHLIEWEQHGYLICGEASNGVEAIEMIKQYSPHIVIADISMVAMDGVELSDYVREHYSDQIKMIMLSSYDNYEYVRETLKNGAVDYLLKHRTDSVGLLGTLSKAKNEILLTESRPKRFNYIEKNWSRLHQEVARTYIKDLLMGLEGNLPMIEEYFRHLSPIEIRNLVVTVIQSHDNPTKLRNLSIVEKNKRMRSILDMIQQCINTENNGIAAELDYGRFVVLIAFPEGKSEHVIYQRLHSCLQRISSTLEMVLNLPVSIGSGCLCHKLSQISSSYVSALKALEHKLPVAGMYAQEEQPFALTLRQEKDLVATIEQGDEFKLDIVLDGIFNTFRNKLHGSSSVSSLMNELIQLADKIWRKSGNKELDYYDGDFPARHEIIDYEKLDGLCEWTKRLYMQLIRKLSAEQQKRNYSAYVYSAMKYVNDHYAENISLEMAAERTGITSSYLGRLFKQEAGIYFTDYLNQIRIENAKHLIRSGHYKVKQISERVGFTNYNYFFKVFKDLVGITPHKYAKSKE
ncbi:MAG: response regulator [Paenibacillus sp.]|nr:response regulator [Paenibacillus sp.]